MFYVWAIAFRRCRIKKEGYFSFLLLDLCLGLEARSRLSSQVKEKIAQLCTKQTFRASAEAFNALMPFSISHLTAHHVVQEIGPAKAQQRWLPLSPLNLIIVLKKLFDQILKLIQAHLYQNIQGLLGQY